LFDLPASEIAAVCVSLLPVLPTFRGFGPRGKEQKKLWPKIIFYIEIKKRGSCHKRQKPQAPTPQAAIHNRQTRKVTNAKVLNRNTNLT